MLYNRDLSWLDFNYRVLLEAASEHVPLAERLNFISIHNANLDEFFSVRYPLIVAMAQLKEKSQKKIDQSFEPGVEEQIKHETERQLQETARILKDTILPQLALKNIYLYYDEPLREEHLDQVRNIFLSKVLAFIQPVHLEPSITENFHLENNILYLAVTVRRPAEEELYHYLLKVPSENLERIYQLSPLGDVNYFVFIDDIIINNLDLVFQGYEVLTAYAIKFNRDAELEIEEDLKRGTLEKIEKQLKKREFAPISRFLYQSGMPDNLLLFIRSIFKIDEVYTIAGNKYHNMKDIRDIPLPDATMHYIPWPPLVPGILPAPDQLFKTLDKTDILLHLPYQSYDVVLSFFNQAAVDPEVDEIFITLYRVASESLIVNSLISAMKNGKKVTAFVELKARFDEGNNINWSKKMKDAGVHIIYSMPEIKVHSKIALITKKGHGRKKMYAILGTGNFNEESAHHYTDHLLLTSNSAINSELLTLFRFLEQRQLPDNKDMLDFSSICVSQFNMIKCFERYIDKEITRAKKNKRGFIRLKLNNLEDPKMVALLYKAARAGVKMQLMIRGICTLVPNENIEVRRLVGRHLEHTRIFIFGEPGNEEVLIGSADWMVRNLHHRIEVCVPVIDNNCRKELTDYFDIQWINTPVEVQKDATLSPTFIVNHDSDAQYAIYKYLAGKK